MPDAMQQCLDEIDRLVVNTLQDGLPVSEQPFADAAQRIGLAEGELIGRIKALLERGVLSRFGPMFDAERIGGSFTLCAMQVPPEHFEEVAGHVNDCPEVAHNYQRDHELNMWFVLGSDDQNRIEEALRTIQERTGFRVYNLPKLKEYYVGLRLEVRKSNDPEHLEPPVNQNRRIQ